MARGSWTRRLLVAGVVVWFATRDVHERELEPLAIEAVPEDPPAPPPAARGTRSFRRRAVTSLAYATIFFAGAALTAGAGNELAQIDAGSPAAAADPAATDSTTTTTTETSTDAAPTVAPNSASAVAPDTAPAVAPDTAPAVAPDTAAAAGQDVSPGDVPTAAPVEEPALAPTPAVDAAPAAADPAPATPDAAPAPATDSNDALLAEASAPAAAPATAPATVPAAAPAASPAAARPHSTRQRLIRKTARAATPARTVNLPIPFQAIAFDPQAWLHNNPASPTGASAVAIAQHYLGVPYRWGGAVPSTGFDCSGLVRFVYQQLGVQLIHYAAAQFASFPKLDPAQLQPGDLVFFEPKLDGPGHVGLYIGNDEMIEAPHTGAVVRISSLSGTAATLGFLGAVRPYAADDSRQIMSVHAAVAPRRAGGLFERTV